ncbi:MAG TPA: protein-L-isoaspartate O-methyltransferase [Planctomycetes bacterium]|nr:protein-L-isoaspartate O-methyltransferase [Planctomycetota bacterium]
MSQESEREARLRMVAEQIVKRGVRDEHVLAALRTVPRHRFVPAELREQAYEDRPLPIGHEQTISQPYIVAAMSEALELRGGERVLEVGCGSGYQAAVLAELAGEVVSVERVAPLAERARALLAELAYRNVEVVLADGSLGHPARAPYDAILVACGASEVPPALLDQLAPGGRLVLPVGPQGGVMRLERWRRGEAGASRTDDLMGVRFVPLLPGTATS